MQAIAVAALRIPVACCEHAQSGPRTLPEVLSAGAGLGQELRNVLRGGFCQAGPKI